MEIRGCGVLEAKLRECFGQEEEGDQLSQIPLMDQDEGWGSLSGVGSVKA